MFVSIMFFVIAAIIAVGAVIYFSIQVVSQSDLVIIERMGRYNRTLTSGMNLIFPFVDHVRATLSIQEEMIDIPKQSVITKDNVSIAVDGVIYLKIANAKDAIYNVNNYKDAISHLAMTTLRGEIGEISLDEILSNRTTLNSELHKELESAAENWGIKVMRVEIAEISVPSDIQEAMNQQMKAEREKRATELRALAEKEKIIREAEAAKEKEVLEAEGIERMAEARKKEKILLATGEMESMKLISEGMQNPLGGEYMLVRERIRAFEQLAGSDSQNKFIIPYETTEMLGSLSVIKDLMSQNVNQVAASQMSLSTPTIEDVTTTGS